MPRRSKAESDNTSDAMITVRSQGAVPRPVSRSRNQSSSSTASKPSEFAFINISNPEKAKDPNNRRKVRKHVMKDIGLSRRKRSAGEPRRTRSRRRSSQSSSRNSTPNPSAAASVVPSPNSAQKSLPADAPPDLVNIPTDPLLNDNQSDSMPLVFRRHDAGLDYLDDLIVSFCGVNVISNFLRENPKCLTNSDADIVKTNESLRKYTDSIEKVRIILQKGDTLNTDSDANVVESVLLLACHALSGVQLEQCDLHRDGYARIMRGHGGFSELEANETLHYALMWIEVLGSLGTDTVPKAPLPQSLIVLRESLTLATHPCYELLESRYPATADILSILPVLHPTTQMSTHQNSATEHSPTQVVGTKAWVSWGPYYAIAAYDLLSLPRSQNTTDANPEANLREALRLCFRAYLILIALAWEADDAKVYFEPLSLGDISSLVRTLTEINWIGLEDLKLWIFLLASIVTLGTEREAMIKLLANVVEEMGLSTWDHVTERLESVAWMETRLEKFTVDLADDVFGDASAKAQA